VTSVTAFPQYPGPRPLLLPSGDEGALHALAAGRPASPPTHDCGPRPAVPVSEGGPVSAGDGRFPLVGVRRAPAVTAANAGIGRGALLRAKLERDFARRRMASAPGRVGFLLEAPWEEGVAASLPPPLLQVPSAPLEQVAGRPVAVEGPITSPDLEVSPPVALADPVVPDCGRMCLRPHRMLMPPPVLLLRRYRPRKLNPMWRGATKLERATTHSLSVPLVWPSGRSPP